MKTKVIFRKEESGVIAIFPYIVANRAQKTVFCYSPNEGHSSCDYLETIRFSKPASQTEANELLKELVLSYGYENLQIMKKAIISKVYGQFYK